MLDAVSMGFLMMLALWEKDVAADQSLAANGSILSLYMRLRLRTLLLAMMSSLTLRLPLLQVETPWTRVDVGFEARALRTERGRAWVQADSQIAGLPAPKIPQSCPADGLHGSHGDLQCQRGGRGL